MSHRSGSTIALLTLANLVACVTINIYFPAAAAEKAADKIIDDVWQIQKGTSAKPPLPDTAPQPAPQNRNKE
jgi:hypothetical protein